MKYICLGYMDEKLWEKMSESERNRFMDEAFTYDDVLRKNGHFAGGEALQSARNATMLRYVNGKVSVTDGPFAKTKEQIGGIMILEARGPQSRHSVDVETSFDSYGRMLGDTARREPNSIGGRTRAAAFNSKRRMKMKKVISKDGTHLHQSAKRYVPLLKRGYQYYCGTETLSRSIISINCAKR